MLGDFARRFSLFCDVARDTRALFSTFGGASWECLKDIRIGAEDTGNV